MQSRAKGRKRIKSRPRHRITLETLDSRLLLNASWHDLDLDDLEDFIQPGYGIPDAFFADPAASDFVGLDLLGGLELDLVTSDSDSGFFEPSDICGFEAAMADSTYTLYLDFDGERVYSRSGDFWLGSGYVDIPAYNLDMFGWAGSEQESIGYITEFVSEDYSPYNIAITNVKPASGDYNTIYVGGTNDWFRANSSVIGVATYDIGNRDASNYGFAFTEELAIYQNYSGGSILNFSEYTANLISHEAAHNFGSNHVSDTSCTMNPYLPLSPRGLSFGSDSKQDTQTLLGNNLGYAHGPDDYGNSYLTAQTIDGQNLIEGMLERRDDVDSFTFTATAGGVMTVDLDTTIYGNLDSYLTVLRNSDATIIAKNDDYAGQADSYLSFDVVAGQQYTINVSSLSQGSSGTYSLAVSAPDNRPRISVTDSSGLSNDQTIDFGTAIVGASSWATFTIANIGFDDLIISQLSTDSDFELDLVSLSDTSSDDIVIAAGDELQVTATFEPDLIGAYSGTVTIVSNSAQQSQLTVDLTAFARVSQPDIAVFVADGELVGDTLDFGDVSRGDLGIQTITVHNSGSLGLQITDVITDSSTSPFTIIDGFTGDVVAIDPGESADITIGVSGSSRGLLDGQITIVSNDPDQPQSSIDLTARMVGGVLSVYDSCGSNQDHQIDFGTVYAGENAQQTITLVNTGDGELTIFEVIVDGGFIIDTGQISDGVVLAVGQPLTVTVGYSPSSMGEVTGTVTIVTDDNESPTATVSLCAVGQIDPLEITELDYIQDGLIDAGDIWIESNEFIRTWQLTNHGSEPLTISLSQTGGTDLQLVGPETIILRANQSYNVNMIVSTELACPITTTLTLKADDFSNTTETLTVSASPYAIVSSGKPYSFTDHTGDRVSISLSGHALAKVNLGTPDQPDIESIQLFAGSEPAKLNINVAGGGSTQLGQLTGRACLSSFNAENVDLVGSGIDLDGQINKLRLSSLLNGAQINFSTYKPATVRLNRIIGESDINIDGDLRVFRVDEFLGGSLRGDSIGNLLLGRLDADIDVTNGDLDKAIVRHGDLNGDINVNGRVGSVKIMNGDLVGMLNAEDNIDHITLSKGTITGTIKSGRIIGKIKAANTDQADIFARNGIDKINILADMSETVVSVGFDGVYQSDTAAAIAELDAFLGSIKVRGTFTASTIAVGVALGGDGGFLNSSANAATGFIGSIDLAQVNTNNEASPFGVVAKDSMAKVRVNSSPVNIGYQQDDFYVTVLDK